jgi:L-ascorbate metabolism protein UlaG (beta-lactamase superfamily)
MLVFAAWLLFFQVSVRPARAQTVKITPLGARTGDFCVRDRALLFEDPTGVRILYDPGTTVAGGTDARLGEVHAILLSHAHADHMGDGKLNQDPNSDSAICNAAPPTTPAPNTNVAEIAAAKNSAVIAGPPLASFLGAKIRAAAGSNSPTAGCPGAGLTNEMTFPRTAPCTGGTGLGAKRTLRLLPATQGVQVAAVTAEHPNELSPAFIPDPSSFVSNGLPGAYVGLANGFVLTFTNGLSVYLSGDTGLTNDMKDVVNAYYRPALSVINIGDSFTIGPQEAAFAVTNLLRTNSVIPSHANEAATNRGVVVSGTRTERFIQLASQGLSVDTVRDFFINRSVSVFVPLSGVTVEFDGSGRCVTGCQGH